MKTRTGIQLIFTAIACLVGVGWSYSAPKPNLVQRALLKVGGGKGLREKVVARYFDGVHQQNREQIVSCFNPMGTKITDVCALHSSERIAMPDELGERCMQFLAAHPDAKVMFHYP
jgi:hypothetical protein